MFIITYTEINKHILPGSENYSNATQCANGNVKSTSFDKCLQYIIHTTSNMSQHMNAPD